MPFPLLAWSRAQVMLALLVMLAEGSPGVLTMTVEVPIQLSTQVPDVAADSPIAVPEKQLTSTSTIEFGVTSSKGPGSLVLTSAANWYLPTSACSGIQR